MIMGLALVCSCVPDHRDSQMPDATVYFSDNTANKGVQQVLVYDVQSEVETPVYDSFTMEFDDSLSGDDDTM